NGITEPIISRKIPFIPIEKLIDGTGEIIIKNIIDGKYQFSYASDKEYKNDDLEKVCKETINEFTTFLNSDKIYPLLCEFIKQIEKLVNKKYDNMFKLRLMIHIACAIERILLNGDLKYESDYSELNTEYIRIVKEAEEYIERAISIKLTDDEIYYIVSILESFDEETEN
ncbi:PRD domain-containing protein, partial [Clostridium butyricum]|uniref:PRD domain-containing protein n=1 Tax=Clostridium butyricum TaxID=1492 RepID=UPI00374E2F6D